MHLGPGVAGGISIALGLVENRLEVHWTFYHGCVGFEGGRLLELFELNRHQLPRVTDEHVREFDHGLGFGDLLCTYENGSVSVGVPDISRVYCACA